MESAHSDRRRPALTLGLGGAAQGGGLPVTVGVVMELTGPAGEYGQAGAKSVEMAFRDLNDAGGPHGCKLVADTRDSQSQGTLAVDAANQLVQLKKVPVIIGGIISSVSIPILTSVTGARQDRADLARLVLADADDARARGQDERHVLPHHHFGRSPGHRGGEICARPGLQEDRSHPRQQRFRRQHAERIRARPIRRSAARSSR